MSEKRGICLRAEGGEREREREERSADHRVKPFHKGMKEKDRNAAIPENKFGMSKKKLEEARKSVFKLRHESTNCKVKMDMTCLLESPHAHASYDGSGMETAQSSPRSPLI